MKIAALIPPLAASAFLTLILGAVADGCGSSQPVEPQAVATPRTLSDLSTLSSKPVNPFSNTDAAFAATHAGANQAEGRAQEDTPGTTRHVGTDASPAEERLLNPKAAQFASFSGTILDQVWGQLRERERDDNIAKLKLSDELKPVIITATLGSDGKLKELVVEQHSGKGLIDRMFIEACKKGVWARNPPREAAGPNGIYQVRLECKLENFATTGKGWTFKTYMGIALL